LTILDPKGVIMFDANTPTNDQLFMDRFIRVVYSVYVSSLDDWVRVPIFTGPITKLEQDGQIVSVEAVGKESIYLAPSFMWHSQTWKRGVKITKVMQDILAFRGEQKIVMPDLAAKLRKSLTVHGQSEGWRVLQMLAKSINRQIFYDGSGHCRLRMRQSTPTYEFSYASEVLSRPKTPYDFTTLRNIIQVRGPAPDDKKTKRIVFTARLPDADGASGVSLARNGKPRPLVTIIDADHIKKMSDARDMAGDAMRMSQAIGGDVSFDALPIPFLEELDPVRVFGPNVSSKFILRNMTIPLLSTESMAVGYNRKVRVRRTRRHHHHGKGKGKGR
jgi:hypothetical protein